MSAASDEEEAVPPPMTIVCDPDRRANIRMAQVLVGKYVPPEVSLVNELLAERRKEIAGP